MKKLMPLALLAAVAWAVWKFVLARPGGPLGGAVPGGFFDAGNQQLGQAWWNIKDWLTPDIQRNNPATGDPIPDARIYPTDPYPVQTAGGNIAPSSRVATMLPDPRYREISAGGVAMRIPDPRYREIRAFM